jgi:hypothetical protein
MNILKVSPITFLFSFFFTLHTMLYDDVLRVLTGVVWTSRRGDEPEHME